MQNCFRREFLRTTAMPALRQYGIGICATIFQLVRGKEMAHLKSIKGYGLVYTASGAVTLIL